jgi:hypothetical protein
MLSSRASAWWAHHSVFDELGSFLVHHHRRIRAGTLRKTIPSPKGPLVILIARRAKRTFTVEEKDSARGREQGDDRANELRWIFSRKDLKKGVNREEEEEERGETYLRCARCSSL